MSIIEPENYEEASKDKAWQQVGLAQISLGQFWIKTETKPT